MSTITLSDRDSFIDFFERFNAGVITDDVAIKFEPPETAKEIPFLRIKGKEYNGTINSLVWNALVIHQRNINRLYSLVKYEKVTKLKVAEVAALRISLQVNKGSSTLIIKNLKEILGFIIPELINPKNAATLALGLLVIFTEYKINHFMDLEEIMSFAAQNQLDRDHTAEQNQLDRDFTAEQNQLDRDFTAEQNQLDRDVLRRERQLIKDINGCGSIMVGGIHFSYQLIQLSKHADVVEHFGQTISSSPEKRDTENLENQISGTYKVLNFGAETDGYFNIELEDVATGDTFNAKLSADIRLDNMRPRILGAVQSGDELNLNIDAILVGNELDDAVITSIIE